MTIEQKKFEFNIENFKNDFKSALEKYVSVSEDFEHKNFEGSQGSTEEREMSLEINKFMKHLTSLSVSALRLADDKQEILNIISNAFFDLHEDTESQYWGEKEYFKNIILELLKTSK